MSMFTQSDAGKIDDLETRVDGLNNMVDARKEEIARLETYYGDLVAQLQATIATQAAQIAALIEPLATSDWWKRRTIELQERGRERDAEITRLREQCEIALDAAGKEAVRTMFTLTPEQGLGQIINAMSLAVGRHPWSGEALALTQGATTEPMQTGEQSALRMAAQMRNDYAWLLAQLDVYGHKWQETHIVDNDLVTYGEGIVEMARNRFRYQSEEHADAFAAMRALVEPTDGTG